MFPDDDEKERTPFEMELFHTVGGINGILTKTLPLDNGKLELTILIDQKEEKADIKELIAYVGKPVRIVLPPL